MEENRKIKYTKQVLKDALFSLLKEKPINNISVKELCEVADINRSTFYLHYENCEDLQHKIEKEQANIIINSLKKEQNKNSAPKDIIKNLTELIISNPDICFWLLNKHTSGYGIGLAKEYASKRFLESFARVPGSNFTIAELHYEFIVVGCLAVMRKWYQEKDRISDQEFRKVFNNVISSSVLKEQ